MGSSEIWDKYHECCIGNGDKFHEAKPSELSIFNATRVVFIPNIIATLDPCYSQLIQYWLHIRMLCISVAMSLCTKHAQH